MRYAKKHLAQSGPFDAEYLTFLAATLSEWDSAIDEKAFRGLSASIKTCDEAHDSLKKQSVEVFGQSQKT
jgi:hypothetical protein